MRISQNFTNFALHIQYDSFFYVAPTKYTFICELSFYWLGSLLLNAVWIVYTRLKWCADSLKRFCLSVLQRLKEALLWLNWHWAKCNTLDYLLLANVFGCEKMLVSHSNQLPKVNVFKSQINRFYVDTFEYKLANNWLL